MNGFLQVRVECNAAYILRHDVAEQRSELTLHETRPPSARAANSPRAWRVARVD